MGNLAVSELPTLSTFVMEMTILPMVMAMWFYSESQMSWALATALTIVFDVGVSFCFDIHSPFSTLVGGDLMDGITILGVLIILNLAYSLIGSFVTWLLDGVEILPIAAIFPMSSKHFISRAPKGTSRGDEGETRYRATGLNAHGMVDLPKPYVHVLITSILFVITVAIPFIIYAFFMDDTGSNNIIALACVIIIPIVGYLMCLVYWYYWRDPYVWGPCVKNLKVMGNRYAGRTSKAIVKADTRISDMKVYKMVVMLAVMHLLSVIVIGSVRITHMDIDWNWTCAAIYAAIIIIITLICYFALYLFRGKEEKSVAVYNTGADEDVLLEEQESETTPMNQSDVIIETNEEPGSLQRSFYASPNQNITHRLMQTGLMGHTTQ